MNNFRLATKEDVEVINYIYNQAIEARHQTADTELYSKEKTLSWMMKHSPDSFPIHVLCVDEKVVAWSSLSPYRPGRKALAQVAEISYYVAKNHQGRGYGKEILKGTIDRAKELGMRTLVAVLLDANVRSKGILDRFGFAEWGRIPGAALIENEMVDHLYYGKKI